MRQTDTGKRPYNSRRILKPEEEPLPDDEVIGPTKYLPPRPVKSRMVKDIKVRPTKQREAYLTASNECPVEHFIRNNRMHPKILDLLTKLENPYDSEGNPRGLNRTTLAELADVTYPVVHRTELAIFERIPPKLLGFMEKYGHAYDHYPVMYKNYRGLIESKHILEERSLALKSLSHWTQEHPQSLSAISTVHSFKDWRSRHFTSVMEMAKMILINPTIIANYESGQTKTLPVGIERQFRKFGMPPEIISAIKHLPVPSNTERV